MSKSDSDSGGAWLLVFLLWFFGNPCVPQSKGCANASDVVLKRDCKP